MVAVDLFARQILVVAVAEGDCRTRQHVVDAAGEAGMLLFGAAQGIIDGAQDVTDETLECRDVKNGKIEINFTEITREAAQIERIRSQIALL